MSFSKYETNQKTERKITNEKKVRNRIFNSIASVFICSCLLFAALMLNYSIMSIRER